MRFCPRLRLRVYEMVSDKSCKACAGDLRVLEKALTAVWGGLWWFRGVLGSWDLVSEVKRYLNWGYKEVL